MVYDNDWFIKFITTIPRLFIRLFHIKHKHHYVYDGTFDGGLAGQVSEYVCIWCKDTEYKF